MEGKLIRSEIDSFLFELDEESINEIGNAPILGYGLSPINQIMFKSSYTLENLSLDHTTDSTWRFTIENGIKVIDYIPNLGPERKKYLCYNTKYI